MLALFFKNMILTLASTSIKKNKNKLLFQTRPLSQLNKKNKNFLFNFKIY